MEKTLIALLLIFGTSASYACRQDQMMYSGVSKRFECMTTAQNCVVDHILGRVVCCESGYKYATWDERFRNMICHHDLPQDETSQAWNFTGRPE